MGDGRVRVKIGVPEVCRDQTLELFKGVNGRLDAMMANSEKKKKNWKKGGNFSSLLPSALQSRGKSGPISRMKARNGRRSKQNHRQATYDTHPRHVSESPGVLQSLWFVTLRTNLLHSPPKRPPRQSYQQASQLYQDPVQHSLAKQPQSACPIIERKEEKEKTKTF